MSVFLMVSLLPKFWWWDHYSLYIGMSTSPGRRVPPERFLGKTETPSRQSARERPLRRMPINPAHRLAQNRGGFLRCQQSVFLDHGRPLVLQCRSDFFGDELAQFAYAHHPHHPRVIHWFWLHALIHRRNAAVPELRALCTLPAIWPFVNAPILNAVHTECQISESI